MRFTIRKLELPILSGIQYRSLLPSIWNRCSNEYDVATGIIIWSLYSLPIPAQTLQALILQHIILLLNINIKKICNVITYKRSNEMPDDIDKFRNLTKKLVIFYRSLILEIRRKCIVPALRQVQAKKWRACGYASTLNSVNICSLTRATNFSTDVDYKKVEHAHPLEKILSLSGTQTLILH